MTRTAAHRLALAIGLNRPLSIEDVQDIVDQSLADDHDFSQDPEDPSAWVYGGDRWAVEYSTGRPRLVEAIDVGPHPVGPATARAERAFAMVMELVDCVGPPMDQERIDRIRDETWAERFRRAAEQDATDALFEEFFGSAAATGDEEVKPDEEG